MPGHITLNQSDNCPQIFVGHKLSHQFGLWPVMADDVELINSIQENFRDNKIQSLKIHNEKN